MLWKFFGTALFAVMASGHANATLVVDGNLADWGIKKNAGASGLIPDAGTHYTIEDQNSSYLNPGYGGQAYDAEALYARIEGQKLFVGLITGHNPLTLQAPAANSYGAGDFAFDFGKDGTYEAGINIKHVINSSGAREAFGVEGGFYRNPVWALGLWTSSGANNPSHADPKNPTYLTGGSYLGMATLAYTTVGATGYGQWASDKHYFYEISVDIALLEAAGWDGHSAFNIHWTENCANDSIIVDPPINVPEPGSLALMSLAFLGIAALRRNRPTPRA